MEKDLEKVFQKAKYEPEENLSKNIWATIVLSDRHATRIKLCTFSFTGLVSLIGLFPAFKILFGDLAHSGFYEYSSLIFSDGGAIISYWREFIFSLLESLPIMSIIFSLALILILFLSLKYLTKQIIKNKLMTKEPMALSF